MPGWGTNRFISSTPAYGRQAGISGADTGVNQAGGLGRYGDIASAMQRTSTPVAAGQADTGPVINSGFLAGHAPGPSSQITPPRYLQPGVSQVPPEQGYSYEPWQGGAPTGQTREGTPLGPQPGRRPILTNPPAPGLPGGNMLPPPGPVQQGPANLRNFRVDTTQNPNIDPGFAQNFNFLMDKYGPAQAYNFAMRNANQGGMMYGRDLQAAMTKAGIDPEDVKRVINQTNQQGNYFDWLQQSGPGSNEYDRNTNTYTFGGQYAPQGLTGGTAVKLPANMTTY